MNKLKLKSQFKNITTQARLQVDDIQSSVPRNESKLGVSKTYWPDFHKTIYMAFKLLDTLPIYSNK